MTRYALWQQLVTYPAEVDRLLIEAAWPMPGRLRGMLVTVATGRDVNIAAGKFVVPLGAGMGSALCVSDAVETATFADAPGAGASRIDLLVVQVRDMAIDAVTVNGFTFDVIEGAPAASPVPPAVPARALALAAVTSVGGQANLAQSNIAQQNDPVRQLNGQLAADVALSTPNAPYVLFNVTLTEGLWVCEGSVDVQTANLTDPYLAATAYWDTNGGTGWALKGGEAARVNGYNGSQVQASASLRPWLWVDVAPGGSAPMRLNAIGQSPSGGIAKALGIYGLGITGYYCFRTGPSLAA
jgi:hypothetical protein